ncbi:MAG TPA: LamG-like jellyroll fold domain-containing protein [Vicinamibacterales bacterium]|nr:LamG-like jellyroll fold domain-containing protein [Vicinamibacterales bacterium]
MTRALVAGLVAASSFAAGSTAVPGAGSGRPTPVVWHLDSLTRVGGHPVETIGAPRVVRTPGGPVVAFDGAHDGLFIDANPLEGLVRFTVEVIFQPAPDGPEEQRFLHFEEAGTGNRALIELRMTTSAGWSLDTYLHHGRVGLTLLDRARAHPAGRWHVAALTFDGRTMSHFVNRRLEGQGDLEFKPLAAGRTSIGVRQNRVSHFKGCIRLIRITPDVLAPASMLEPR